jgi:hypothetical protein
MKSSELRIGNYVTIDNPQSWPALKDLPFKVQGIDLHFDESFPESTGTVTAIREDDLHPAYDSIHNQFDQFIKPIPLTEEWLLKFGFESIGELNPTYKLRNYLIELSIMRDHWVFRQTINKEDSLCLSQNLHHVHQLQNLYFSLTGKELVASI